MKIFFGLTLGLTIAYAVHVFIQPKISTPQYVNMKLTGQSMEQFGFYDGMRLKLVKEPPRVGDYVSFQCTVKGCPAWAMFKRLVAQDEDCYWFQGRDDEWEQDGKKVHSLDSRTYGWVCKKDIVILGVLHHETHPEKAEMFVSKRNISAQPVCSSETQSDYPKTRILRGNATPQDIH